MPTTDLSPEQQELADRDELHLLVLEMRDERDRTRRREALWLSVIFHLALLLVVILAPKYLPDRQSVIVATPADMLRDRQLTYLELPPDAVTPKERPKTDIISDKDRIASSRAPQLNREELRKILDSARPGAPGPGGMPARPTPASPGSPQPSERAGMQAPPSAPGEDSSSDLPPMERSAQARLEALRPGGSGMKLPPVRGVSPGTAIEQAARASAGTRGGYGGAGGEYGLGIGQNAAQVRSNIDILSDTMGVDFGPYLSRVLHQVRINWFNLIPEVARAPLRKKGKVSIQFAITKDGRVQGMRLIGPSGDVALDRAAWGGITASNPFPPLPPEFGGQYLALRFHFYYNPDQNELR